MVEGVESLLVVLMDRGYILCGETSLGVVPALMRYVVQHLEMSRGER